MFFYELNYNDCELDFHYIVCNEKEFSKEEFKKLCEDYFHQFPKNNHYDKLTGKKYYTFDDYECLNFIIDHLVEDYGFNRVNILHYYSNYKVH